MLKIHEDALRLYYEHGCSVTEAAKAAGVPRTTMASRVQRAKSLSESPNKKELVSKESDNELHISSGATWISTLEELVMSAHVDMETWAVKNWSTRAWVSQSNNGPIQAHHVSASFVKRNPFNVRPVQPIQSLPREIPTVRYCNQPDRTLFVPDSQNGYFWGQKKRTLHPFHDRRALDICVQVAMEYQPETIIFLGDMADCAMFSKKFLRHPKYTETTQPTLDELYWWISQFRLACPSAHIVYLDGNHEKRVREWMISDAKEMVDIHRVGEKVGVTELPYLLALDTMSVEYVGFNTKWWLNESIAVYHGDTVVNGGGATVARVLKTKAAYSRVFGHIHRRELAFRTIRGPHGVYEIFAVSPGCTCRVDGVVPSHTKDVDWQQGFCMLSCDDEIGTRIELGTIIDGVGSFHGKKYVGKHRLDEIISATGWLQFVE